VEKHHHLEKWAEKETLRKSGLKEFGSQFNSNLREPKTTNSMTEVRKRNRPTQAEPST
jgi:hypothetical protein